MGELVVGVPHRGPSVVTLPFDLAATSPALKDGGVALTVVEGTYAQLSGWLASGRIHLCRRGPDVDVVAAARGAPVASCASVMQAAPAEVVAREDVTGAAGLEGRTVGVIDPAMGSTLALQAWLRAEGVAVDRVRLEVLGGTRERLEALAAGRVAATVVTAPGAAALPAGTRSLVALDEALGPFLFSAVQVHRPSAEQRADDIILWLRAVMEAIEQLAGGGDVSARVADLLHVDLAVADSLLARACRKRWYPPRMAFDRHASQAMVDALAAGGHVSADLPDEAWLDDDLRLAAAGRLD